MTASSPNSPAPRVRCSAGESFAEALVRAYRDSDRLIILDNAQRLTERSRQIPDRLFDDAAHAHRAAR